MITIFNRLFSSVIIFCLFTMSNANSENQKAPRQMVVAANPYAARAGMDMLKAGGSAVDAAIAVEMVLGLVEPQSSGIGGGAFMMYYNSDGDKGHRITAYDGREMAPAASTPDMFKDVIEQKKGFYDAVLGGRSVGTPSMVAMLYMAHQKHGKLPWKDLFAPAIKLATAGFEVSPRLHFLISRDKLLPKLPVARAYFFDEAGTARPVGYLLKNPLYAQSLQLIAVHGPDGFYKGKLAKDIVTAVTGSAFNPGKLTLEDMANYQPKQREAICGAYRIWRICGMPPPSSGGGAVAAILGILQSFDLKSMKPNSEQAVHLILEAERLGYADRDLYMADSDYVDVPLGMFTDPVYQAERAKKINPSRSMGRATAGMPPKENRIVFGAGMTPELPSTSHFSILDQWGHMVSMTATVESAFGSRVMVGGFMLNNEMTDFSLIAEKDGKPVANHIEPGKRPRSSMSPTFVLDRQGQVVMAIGSPGGNSIIAYVTQTIINVLDWDMGMQEAINQPHFMTRGGTVYLERETDIKNLAEPLTKKGHQIQVRTINSGLHGILLHHSEGKTTFEGGADMRREGVVITD